MGNQQATSAELGWLAGIIDGEGWLGMTITNDRRGGDRSNRNRRTVKCELKVTNCDVAIIDKTAALFQQLGVNPYLRSHAELSFMRRPVYECATKHMTGVEKIIRPLRGMLVGNKQERADVILEFIALRRANPGILSPAYETDSLGRHGPRTLRPYTEAELALVERCRELQARGASETSRGTREEAVRDLRRSNALRQQPRP